jgi:hypothetical protein
LEWPSRPGFPTRIRGRCPSCSATADLRELLECAIDGGLVALALPALERFATLTLDLGIRRQDPAVGAGGEWGVLGLGEGVLPHDLDLALLDLGDARAVGLDELLFHVGDGLDRTAMILDGAHLLASALGQLVGERLHHVRALEDVGVVEQIGLVGEDLLDPQAPLLVPGPGQTERLVPGGKLDRASPGAAPHRHRQRLEHDPGHVVLRLRLGEAQRVHLDPVAHAKVLRLGDAVPVAADVLPQLPHRAELRVLLDEADAGVDEERDPTEDPREVLVRHLATRLGLVEDGDRGRERVGDLLDRRRARLLEVVAADVDRVPARNIVDAERDRVRDQPHRGLGREGVRAAREVFLDDVVLGRPLELGAVDAVLLGDGDVEGEQPRGRRVDRHRGVHLVEGDPVEERVHVALVRDRDPDLADLAPSEDVIGVVAGLGG